ncbi:AzlD domain-containing protein [Pasteurellaceae bacterium USgator11]|nr:AzlD domain-containing protein [Pasteurellaceae bacterium USgator41]TNG97001.1 AzlD domain-containing protein [Pasteurellaceae bacterium UScroc12]TNG98392.1 AzlD domain-containing protein [Pasteurellaceae bacterium UScroc31]TNH01426.1 AzlD domain-containing protein [Pasteurellaceae bacterium USgator11]
MNTITILVTVAAMASVMLLCRALPLFLPQRWLQLGWLQSLNQSLPLCIMLILLFSSLKIPTSLSSGFTTLLYEIAALAVVLASYIWLRNTLLSVVLGVTCLNLLYLLGL